MTLNGPIFLFIFVHFLQNVAIMKYMFNGRIPSEKLYYP